MGKDEKKLVEIARRQNMPLPARIQNAPELEPGLAFYYDIFSKLTTSRLPVQGGIGAIPYAAISGYCRDEGIDDVDTREDVFYHVERLDVAYIQWQTAKMESNRGKG